MRIKWQICFNFLFCLLLVTPSLAARRINLTDEARIWINQTAALEVQEAVATHQEIFLKFNVFIKDSGSYKTFFAKAQWQEDIAQNLELNKNTIVNLQIIDEKQWQKQPAALGGVEFLSKEHWKIFRSRLAHKITPQQHGQGIVIRSNEDELILFYDESDFLQVVDIKAKPSAVQITNTLTQLQLNNEIVAAMQDYLQENNIDAARVLISVDNEDDYTNPFLYIDLKQSLVLNLRLPVGDQEKYRTSLLKRGMKSAEYLLFDSYVLGIWKRPVSSSLRLFSWTQSTTRDIIKPPSLQLFESKPPAVLNKGEGMNLDAFEEKLTKQIGAKLSMGTMDFLIGGDEFFIQMIDRIIAAKKSIYVRIFIFDNDDYAVSIADLLKRKSKEGVKVKVLLDGMGQVMGEGKLPDNLPSGFVPPSSIEKYLRKDSKIEVRIRPNAWFKADHTKTIIIDEEMFFAGGMNIGREYRYDWHDLMIEVRGNIVDEIVNEFEIAWAHAGAWGDLAYLKSLFDKSEFRKQEEGSMIRTLYTRLNDPQIYKAQLLAIKEAKRYIYVHNSYLSDDAIIYELIKARRRGVDVRVILPIEGNHSIMNANNVVSANTMFRNGIRVFFYPGMSHVKAAIYDGWLCTGSANFDKLSFIDNLELNLATSDKRIVEDIKERLFDSDFKKSKEMTELLGQGWKERLAEFLAEHL